MLMHAMQAVDNFLGQLHLTDLHKYRITEHEWKVLQDYEIILSVNIPTASNL